MGELADKEQSPFKLRRLRGTVELTYGEMLAMADLFGSVDEVQKAPMEELLKCKELIKRQRERGLSSVSEKEWDDATHGRYMQLNAANVSHFEGDNKTTWLTHHRWALTYAGWGNMEMALFTNAFGDHFLGDAFSAGHLVNKREVMSRARTNVERGANAQNFSRAVASKLLDAVPELYDYEASENALLPGGWHSMSTESLGKVIDLIRKWESDTYFSMFVKAVHDRLNTDIKEGPGIEVRNAKGRTWRLPGDKTLDLRPDNPTKAIAQQAIAQSRQNIVDSKNRPKLTWIH
jgi:hypothetical protein